MFEEKKSVILEQRYRTNVGELMAHVRKKQPWADPVKVKKFPELRHPDALQITPTNKCKVCQCSPDENVNKMIKKFPLDDFVIMLFHYNGIVDDWKNLEWSSRAIHISAISQTKWWFAKRFLHPDVVSEYAYILQLGFFRMLVSMGLDVGRDISGIDNEVKLTNSNVTEEPAAFRVRLYVKRSLEGACKRVEDTINLISKLEGKHPLALLASELRMIAERELSLFSPVLCQWYPDAGLFASIHLHQFYGERLKPFLDDISLSEDAISVLSAAHHLEHYLIQASNSKDEEKGVGSFSSHELNFYQIHKISRPIILDWLISQHERILEWTGRAFHLEVWEPLSNQQREAASSVEVFRIVEEVCRIMKTLY